MRLPFTLGSTQALIALGIAAAVVTALYLLRERYRPVLVSHLPLWEESVKRSTPLSLARRLRKMISMLVQMAMLALVIIALTDPGWGDSRDPRSTVLVVDVSPSMASLDGRDGRPRIEDARAFALALARASREGDTFLLVAMSAAPRVDRSWGPAGPDLTRAIGALAPVAGEADLAATLAFAAAAVEGRPGGSIWVMGDGATETDPATTREVERILGGLAKAGVETRHDRCGSAAENVAITRFALRQDLVDRMRFAGMLEVARFGSGDLDRPIDAHLEIRAGGHPVEKSKITLRGRSETVWLDLPSPPSRDVEALLRVDDASMNLLADDDAARVKLPEVASLAVLAVSSGSTYLQAALLLSPGWEVEWIEPGGKPSRARYDVIVLDGDVPRPAALSSGILALNPTGPDAAFPSDGTIQGPWFETYDRDHPITRWTNLFNVNIAEALHLVTEKDDRILGKHPSGPLMVLREREGEPRLLVLGFDLGRSDMPMRVSWPLFFLNAIHYLGGESLEVSSSTASPAESRIAPRWMAGTRHFATPPAATRHRPPLWLVLAAVAAMVLLVEWVTYHRRITV